MSYMKQIAEMLNVDWGKQFKLKDSDGKLSKNTFYFTEYDLREVMDDEILTKNAAKALEGLLNGTLEVFKLPYKPKIGDKFYYIVPNGIIYSSVFTDCCFDLILWHLGLCYPSEKEAENDKDRAVEIYSKILEELRS